MKKKKDLFDLTMENVALSSGIMVGTGIVGQLGTMFPSTSSTKIMQGMEPMAMLPTINSMSYIMGSMKKLQKLK